MTTLKCINDKLFECFSEDDSLQNLASLDAELLREDLSWLLDGEDLAAGEECWVGVVDRLNSLAQVDGGMVWSHHKRDCDLNFFLDLLGSDSLVSSARRSFDNVRCSMWPARFP